MTTAPPVSLQGPKRRKRVLLVDDDAGVRTIVGEVCRREGYEVIEAATGGQGLAAVAAHEPDLILLDWVLPDLSGIDVCRELRRRGAACPVIMLTGRTSKVDVVVGLEVGADDYITKPFDARELTARLTAHLRRTQMDAGAPPRRGLVRVGELEIDTEGRHIRVGESQVKLTLTEFNLLALLVANQGRVMSRDQLLEKVWGYEAEVDNHSVDPHIQRLRRKLEAQGDPAIALDAVPGLGYRLTARN
ncbi:MAG: response regulator transcription factor [Candidatus Dormibacteraeota bacterium]|nr:response regulator transcription factor [Candidatus Dormibacteraeota bacterium]